MRFPLYMRFPLALAVVFVACAGSTAHADEANAVSLIAFDTPVGQSEKRLVTKWRALGAEKRKRIEGFFITRLGLSSTGRIQLIGAYQLPPDGQFEGEHQALLHFRQLDLMGGRLFWSVLVDPDAETVHVLYHVDKNLTTDEPLAFATFE